MADAFRSATLPAMPIDQAPRGAGPLIPDQVATWHEFIDFGKMNIQVCGMPSDTVLAGMRHLGSGVPLSVETRLAGFTRLQAR